jgi:hypothetical protein
METFQTAMIIRNIDLFKILPIENIDLFKILPIEIIEYIFKLAIFPYTWKVRRICSLSNNIFWSELFEKSNREKCRESLCSNILQDKSIHGRYCSLDCMLEHLVC